MKKLFALSALVLSSMAVSAQVNVQLHYDMGRATNPDAEPNRQAVTTTVEMFKADKLGSTYFFVDFDYRGKNSLNDEYTRGTIGAYWEISRDFTFAKIKNSNHSFTAHAEYDGGLNVAGPFQQAVLAGPAWQWHSDNFKKTFTLQVLYKHFLKGNGLDAHASFQITPVWGITFADDWCTFSGFADLWYGHTPYHTYDLSGDKGLVFLTEPQLWVNVLNRHKSNGRLSIGTEWEISNNFIWYAAPAKQNRTIYFNPTIALKWDI